MLIIPAIDLKDGKCVRLMQGKEDKQTVYSEDPASVALKFNQSGAKRLHVVDLDGAFKGSPQNIGHFIKIRENFDGVIEFGGGVRSEEDVEKLIKAGVNKIVIGTMSYKSETFVKKCIDKFGDIFIAGIDAINGFAAIKGWIETTNIEAEVLACKMESLGVSEIIFTDILRDGTLAGPNLKSLENILNSVSVPVISSGGVSSADDVENLARFKDNGLKGVIIGKAIYTGGIDLKEVIKCWQNE